MNCGALFGRSLGLTGTMADPRLELYHAGTLFNQNDDWGDSATLSSAFSSVGAFGFIASSRDAALLQSVDGTRSVQLKGTGPGVALVELYDTGRGNSPRRVNVSARNQVGAGDNILIFGFFVDGTGTKTAGLARRWSKFMKSRNAGDCGQSRQK
jgi:hypothetical protein